MRSPAPRFLSVFLTSLPDFTSYIVISVGTSVSIASLSRSLASEPDDRAHTAAHSSLLLTETDF